MAKNQDLQQILNSPMIQLGLNKKKRAAPSAIVEARVKTFNAVEVYSGLREVAESVFSNIRTQKIPVTLLIKQGEDFVIAKEYYGGARF